MTGATEPTVSSGIKVQVLQQRTLRVSLTRPLTEPVDFHYRLSNGLADTEGTVTVVQDADWLRDAVTLLTDVHEGRREERWHVTDAPADYVDKQLRAIVGLDFVVERAEGKAKLSQNRSDADRLGVVEALGDHPVAAAMRRTMS